jgi:hypothetical protein
LIRILLWLLDADELIVWVNQHIIDEPTDVFWFTNPEDRMPRLMAFLGQPRDVTGRIASTICFWLAVMLTHLHLFHAPSILGFGHTTGYGISGHRNATVPISYGLRLHRTCTDVSSYPHWFGSFSKHINTIIFHELGDFHQIEHSLVLPFVAKGKKVLSNPFLVNPYFVVAERLPEQNHRMAVPFCKQQQKSVHHFLLVVPMNVPIAHPIA